MTGIKYSPTICKDYLDWIKKFVVDKNNFFDTNILFEEHHLSDDELDNVFFLSEFFQLLSEYSEFFQKPFDEQFDSSFYKRKYYLEFENKVYEFGFLLGKSKIHWVKRVDHYPENRAIDSEQFLKYTEEVLTKRLNQPIEYIKIKIDENK